MNEETPAAHPLHRVALAYAILTMISLYALGRLEAPLAYYGVEKPLDLIEGTKPLRGILVGLGAGALLAIGSEVATRLTSWGRAITRMLRRIVGPTHPLDALLLALLSAVAEELLFRGIVQPYLGYFFASALFGAVHFVPRKGLWPWSIWALGAGFLFGWMAKWSGGIAAPAAAHATVNFVGLLTLGSRRA